MGFHNESDLIENRGLGLTRQRLEIEYGRLAKLKVDNVEQGFFISLVFDKEMCYSDEFECFN